MKIKPELQKACNRRELRKALGNLDDVKQDKDLYFRNCFLLLQRCGEARALLEIKEVHTHIVKVGFNSRILTNTLVHLYNYCGSLADAQEVFDKTWERDEYTWSRMIIGYAQHGDGKEAINLCEKMQEHGLVPGKHIYISVLNAYGNARSLEYGKYVHSFLLKNKIGFEIYVASTLIAMYAKCGSIDNAYTVFNIMPIKDVVSWNSMIAGYAQNGNSNEAFKIFGEMQHDGLHPNEVTYANLLFAFAKTSLSWGKYIHVHLIEVRLTSNPSIGNALIDMYAKACNIKSACQVFDNMATQDAISWGILIMGFVRYEQIEWIVTLFCEMQQHGFDPENITYGNVLNACGDAGVFAWGQFIHAKLLKLGLEFEKLVANEVVNMYIKCQLVKAAGEVFLRMPTLNIVAWNSLISGYAQLGGYDETIKLFCEMQLHGLKPDKVTYANIFVACADIRALGLGKLIHSCLLKAYLEVDDHVHSTLVSMYTKCGCLRDARQIFDKLEIRNLVLWTTMISGYAEHGDSCGSLRLFEELQHHGLMPDSVLNVIVLSACASVGALKRGESIHKQLIDSVAESNVFVGSALVDMYCKCGSIKDARSVFDNMVVQNVILWSSMISGYAEQGSTGEALLLFEQMQQQGVKPDEITFTAVLSVCSYAAFVGEGLYYFESISRVHGVKPMLQHYACVVDLLGRSGQLMESRILIDRMPFQPDVIVWRAFLGACRINGDLQLAEQTLTEVLRLDSNNGASFLLLSNLYATSGWTGDSNLCIPWIEDDKTLDEHRFTEC